MLTATYSLVAITAEQDKARSLLRRLQQFVQTSWKGLQTIDFGFLQAGCERMQQFDHFFQNRKIEVSLIPALKGVNCEADLLIAELESLRNKAGRVLHDMTRQLAVRVELSRIQVSQLCESMQIYCAHVSSRLQLEEQSLLPLARSLLSVEDWFRLAADFLSRDGSTQGRRVRSMPARVSAHIGSSNDLR